MIKFFRRIRFDLMDKNKPTSPAGRTGKPALPTGKYMKYAIGEIVLVVIGILIALQINNWNSKRIEQREEISSYENIKRQINDDRNVIFGIIDYNDLYYKQFNYANQIIEQNDQSKIDTLGKITLKLYKYSDYNRSSDIYQNLVNSGELKLLKNREIIEQILRLEETYIYMNRMERIHFEVIMSGPHLDIHEAMKFSDRSARNPEALYGVDFQNHFIGIMGIMNEKNEVYQRAINEIDIIIASIDQELK